ncbi:MAG: YraN family protein [Lachnospiraceae bacterium]|nr:YraN family protein [Lachnospiraceae bacterium]
MGSLKEEKAAKYLENKGFSIVERNYYTWYGEIDIIARKNRELYFVEVKYRKNANFGYPEEAVGAKKLHNMRLAANRYIITHGISEDCPIKFSLVAILGDEIKMFESLTL